MTLILPLLLFLRASPRLHRKINVQMQEQGAQRIRALNGGLWGPNEEEEREIAQGLFRLDEVEVSLESTDYPSFVFSARCGGHPGVHTPNPVFFKGFFH